MRNMGTMGIGISKRVKKGLKLEAGSVVDIEECTHPSLTSSSAKGEDQEKWGSRAMMDMADRVKSLGCTSCDLVEETAQ